MKVSEPEIGQESERTQRQVGPDTNRHNDVYAWLLSQANRLREYRPEAIDWFGLAEELEDFVALQRAKWSACLVSSRHTCSNGIITEYEDQNVAGEKV